MVPPNVEKEQILRQGIEGKKKQKQRRQDSRMALPAAASEQGSC